ncbi:MAG: hypothetical protein MUF24_14820 [Chitinophagaceae bacterium]|nr:hypothetical protein [Chitinophagaceae bacterium]
MLFAKNIPSWLGFSVLLLIGCSEKKIDLQSPALAAYFPLKVGKYIEYRLDSTVLTQFGRDTTVRSYRVRDSIETEITDARGRKGVRMVRYMRDVAGTLPYRPAYTFMAVNSNGDWIEFIENNLRFMKLRFPVREGFEWKGNSFIETNTLNSDVRYLADWTYRYLDVDKPLTLNGKTYDSTITILQRDEVIPEGPFNPQFFKQYDYSIEIYAKNIGLIYKNFDHKVWQPPTPPPDSRPGFWEDGSFRIILSAINHN